MNSSDSTLLMVVVSYVPTSQLVSVTQTTHSFSFGQSAPTSSKLVPQQV